MIICAHIYYLGRIELTAPLQIVELDFSKTNIFMQKI